jgi:hypothetical protein
MRGAICHCVGLDRGDARLVEAEGEAVVGRAAARELLADALLHAIELELEDRVGRQLLADRVEAAVGEGGVLGVRAELVVEAGLVVPELDARAGLHEREHAGGVAVAAGEGERAAGLAAAAVDLGEGLAIELRGLLLAAAGRVAFAVEGDLDEAAGVGEADLEFTVVAVAPGGLGAALDHAADVASEAGRGAAGVEVDLVDEIGVDDGGADRHVEEDRDADAVEEVAGVAGGGAADDDVGQEAGQLRGAREALDHAEGVAEGAGEAWISSSRRFVLEIATSRCWRTTVRYGLPSRSGARRYS